MAATPEQVRAVLGEVGSGAIDAATAVERIKGLGGFVPVVRPSREAVLGFEDIDSTPGSVVEIAVAEARRVITREQADAMLDAFRPSRGK